jgi:hypothetical protein
MWSSRVRTLALGSCVVLVTSASTAHADGSAPALQSGSASVAAAVPPASASSSPATPSPEQAEIEHDEKSTGRPLVWIGATIFSVSYIAAVLRATTSYPSATDITTPHGALWIPVVGPFIDMGHTSGAANIFLLALDGAAQIGGLTLFVYGQTTPSTTHARDVGKTVTIRVAPVLAPGTGGAAVFAKF